MNRSFIGIYFVVCCVFCMAMACRVAGQTAELTLSGNMVVATGEKFPYRVVFTELEGVVKGFSYTFSAPNETKAVIKGVLDRMSHTLRFKETEIVSSHGVATKAFMCLVNAKLEYAHTRDGNELKGAITSADIDKAACTPGNIVFNNDGELQKVFAQPREHYDTVISMKKKVKEPVAATAAPAAPVKEEIVPAEKVTAGTEKSYEWHSDTVVLDVWDGGQTDNDRISIQFNGKTILSQYYLTQQHKRLSIALEGNGINTLVIKAENEGSEPPNTATLLLGDGAKKYSVVAYNLKGQQALIKIKRVR